MANSNAIQEQPQKAFFEVDLGDNIELLEKLRAWQEIDERWEEESSARERIRILEKLRKDAKQAVTDCLELPDASVTYRCAEFTVTAAAPEEKSITTVRTNKHRIRIEICEAD